MFSDAPRISLSVYCASQPPRDQPQKAVVIIPYRYLTEDDRDTGCVFCGHPFDKFEGGTHPAISLPCLHIYGKSCLAACMKSQGYCPDCVDPNRSKGGPTLSAQPNQAAHQVRTPIKHLTLSQVAAQYQYHSLPPMPPSRVVDDNATISDGGSVRSGYTTVSDPGIRRESDFVKRVIAQHERLTTDEQEVVHTLVKMKNQAAHGRTSASAHRIGEVSAEDMEKALTKLNAHRGTSMSLQDLEVGLQLSDLSEGSLGKESWTNPIDVLAPYLTGGASALKAENFSVADLEKAMDQMNEYEGTSTSLEDFEAALALVDMAKGASTCTMDVLAPYLTIRQ